VAFEDIASRRTAERALSELMQQKEVLLEEVQHRFANGLQLIASILMRRAARKPAPVGCLQSGPGEVCRCQIRYVIR
jgi:two-component sensor histidine kinase